MNHLKIRKEFIHFFKKKDHKHLPSSSLIPQDDPSLLFVNAGMNPFKNIFLGLQKPPYKKIVSIQKCLRVGGKHNDLEQVGRSPTHHTFFEMMGNFSFGDYFKEEALNLSWEFLTKNLNIPKEKLWISVFENDEETYSLWREKQNIPNDRIFKSAEKDNFWRMGNEGPCGPCSEIYYYEGVNPKTIEDMIEIWNLVFMEFYEDSSGKKQKLPLPCVDTGVGLERLASVLQKTSSNYQTDLLYPLINALEEASRISYKKEPTAFQVISDHSRAIAFLISDGIIPGNEGQNYVLRRLLRRAFHYNQKLSTKNLVEVAVKEVISQMKSIYPELEKEESYAQELIENEKEKFFLSLEQGQKILLKKMKSSTEKIIDTPLAWDLYSTYGFPFDLTRLIAKEKGFQMEAKSEEEIFKHNPKPSFQKEKSNKIKLNIFAFKKSNVKLEKTDFTGYGILKEKSSITSLLSLDSLKTISSLRKGEEAWCVTKKTCFYPEGGGQVGDLGQMQTSSAKALVLDCQKQEETIFHKIKVSEGSLKIKDKVELIVDSKHRFLTKGSHSATHLLNAALRKTLKTSLRQAGSLVEAGRLRFDFTHPKPLTMEQIKKIELEVQKNIEARIDVSPSLLPYEKALKEGALSMAGDNYPKMVRVIQMLDRSKELCGGTHVSNTYEIGNFKIISETGVQSGIRRIEAYTGTEATQWLNELARQNLELRDYLKIPRPKNKESSSPLLEKIKKIERELKTIKNQVKQAQSSEDNWEELTISKNISAYLLRSPLSDRKILADVADKKKSQGSSVVIVFGKNSSAYPVIVTVSKDLLDIISAHDLLKNILIPHLGGKGGGQDRFAQGEVSHLNNLQEVRSDLVKKLKNL